VLIEYMFRVVDPGYWEVPGPGCDRRGSLASGDPEAIDRYLRRLLSADSLAAVSRADGAGAA